MAVAYICVCAANAAAVGFWLKRYGKKWAVLAAAAALIFSVVLYLRNRGIYGLFCISVEGILLTAAAEDVIHMSVPTKLLIILMAAGAATVFFVPDTRFWVPAVTAVVFGGILYIVSKKSHGSVGMADVACITAEAFCLPFDVFVQSIFLSLFAAFLWGVSLMLFKKKSAKTQIPFIPFIAFSYIAAVILM